MIECPRCKHRDFIVPYETTRVEHARGLRRLFGAWKRVKSGGLLTCAACLHQFGYNEEGSYALRRGPQRPAVEDAPASKSSANGEASRLRTPDISWSQRGEE